MIVLQSRRRITKKSEALLKASNKPAQKATTLVPSSLISLSIGRLWPTSCDGVSNELGERVPSEPRTTPKKNREYVKNQKKIFSLFT